MAGEGMAGQAEGPDEVKVSSCNIAALPSSLVWVREQEMGQRATPSPWAYRVPVMCVRRWTE